MKNRELLVWTELHNFIEEHGYTPTMRQIGSAIFWSHTAVSASIDVLDARGIINIEYAPDGRKLMRTLRLVKKPPSL